MTASTLLKSLFGISLVPLCLGFSLQFLDSAFTVRYRPLFPYYFVGGVLSYLALHLLFRKPIITYVFGHELTHALFALLFGGSVKAFHATERGGRVTITRSNFLITLAPYFFPLYTVIVLCVYAAARAANVSGAEPWLVFLAGVTFAFHLVLTAVFLSADQDDIREQGALFSYPLIYLFNVLFASVLLRLLLSEGMNYPKFMANGIIRTMTMLRALYGRVASLF